MACLYPQEVRVKYITRQNRTFKVPCRSCVQCRIKRSSDLTFLGTIELGHTYRQGYGASFVTLTYSDTNLPLGVLRFLKFNKYSLSTDSTLLKRDLQLYMKRFRRRLEYSNKHKGTNYNSKFKVLASGEYGDDRGRPHYHIIFMGLDASEVASISKGCWSKGFQKVETLDGVQGLRYVTKYLETAPIGKQAKQLFKDNDLEPPFMVHSKDYGLSKVLANLGYYVDHNFCYYAKGKWLPLPKNIRKRMEALTGKHYNSHFLFNENCTLQQKLESQSHGFSEVDDFMRCQSLIKARSIAQNMRRKGFSIDNGSFTEYTTWQMTQARRCQTDLLTKRFLASDKVYDNIIFFNNAGV